MSASQKCPVEIKAQVDGEFAQLLLVFSVDNGMKWYEVEMVHEPPFYIVRMPPQPKGRKILYVLKAIGKNGEEFLENNSGQFYTYIVGAQSKPMEQTSSNTESLMPEEFIDNAPANKIPIPPSEESQPNKASERPPIISQKPSAEEDSLPFAENEKVQIKHDMTNSQSKEEIKPQIHEEVAPKLKIDQKISGEKEFQENPFQDTKNIRSPLEVTPNIIKKEVPASPSMESKDEKMQIIIPYNPFSIKDGNIGSSNTAIQSFSKIIGFKQTTAPGQKSKNFVNRPQMENSKSCGQCKALVNPGWKICPICGSKV